MTTQETNFKKLNEASFRNIKAFNLVEARKKIILPVTRENMISVENGFPSSYQMVLLNNSNNIVQLGEVKATRPFILHEDLMDWLCECKSSYRLCFFSYCR